MSRARSMWLVVALSVLFAPVLAACLPSSTFTITLPVFGGVPGVDQLPVALKDESGFAAGLEVGVPGLSSEPPPSAITAAGWPAALQIQWRGGMCDKQARLALSNQGGKLRLIITTDRGDGACRLGGIERAVVIRFRQPIQPAQLEIVEQND